jgi:hypothetical protein
MKFSRSQILMLINMQERLPDHEYYAETGRFKPYTYATIKSLSKRKFIKVAHTACDLTVFYVVRGENFDQVPKFTWDDYVKAR